MAAERIEVRESKGENSGHVIKLIEATEVPGVSMGHLLVDITIVDGKPNHVSISELTVAKEGQGLGPRLLRVLVDHLGPGIPMSSAIDHEQSDQMLEDDGWYARANKDSGVSITNQNYLQQIPIVRIYERGGFVINKIGFEVSKDDEPFAMLYAVTTGHSNGLQQ